MAAQNPNYENAIKAGWIEKKSRHLGWWRRRYAVLIGATLYTFKKKEDKSNPTEIIDLKVFSSVKSSEDQTRRKHSFDVYSSEVRFSIVAGSENEKEDWIRHVGRAIVLSNNTSIIDKEYSYGDPEDDEENNEAK